MTSAFNHIGLCVRDLERSKRFYTELLGFELEREITPPDDVSSKLMGLTPPLGFTAAYLLRDGLVLELLHFAAPEQATEPRARTMNEPGLTHVSVSVDDIDAVVARVAEYGGATLPDTRIANGVFIRDPDGQLLELLPMSYREHLASKGYR
jgi:lactoylglutathione lyase